MLVSIIVPVYNTPTEYLEECISSVNKQLEFSKELLIIDDGSKQECAKVCDQLSEQYDFVKVIHKKNEGVSIARNYGIELAQGEYLMFLDSDDCWEDNYLSSMFSQSFVCDALIGNFYRIDEKGKKITREFNQPDYVLNNQEKLLNAVFGVDVGYPQLMLNTVWGKAYKRQIIIDNNVRFPEKIKRLEDASFNLQYFSYAESVSYIDKSKYLYRMSSSSTVNTYDPELADNITRPLEWMKDYLHEKNLFEKYKSAFGNRILLNVLLYFDTEVYKNSHNRRERLSLIKSFLNMDTNKYGIKCASIHLTSGLTGKIYLLLLKLHMISVLDIIMRFKYDGK